MTLAFDNLLLTIEAFHFLRPWWLVLLIAVAWIWWQNRRPETQRDQPVDGLAPHLRLALTVGGNRARRFQPIDSVAAVLVLAVLGASGPSWTRQVDPFLAQTGPLVIVLKVTPSMTTPDVAPTRLDRAKFKIRDLLDLRAGARTALVAYAGTAHRVLPFTEDAAVMRPYLEGLEPEVMPSDGANATAALELAQQMMAGETTPGGILMVLDGLNTADLAALNVPQDQSLAVHMIAGPDVQDPGIDQLVDVPVVRVTADDSDVRQLDRLLNADYRRAMLQNGDQPWEDRGWWLAIPAALIGLFWFRQGWTMRWAVVVLALSLGLGTPAPARADGIADWFLTPDQQGQRAFRQKDFARAAELFVDPMWKGYALYRAGKYSDAVEVLNRLDTAQATFTKGMAHIRNREYRDGVRAFEAVVEMEPDYPGAAENLALSREIVDYVESAREQSDTGEESGIGADDVVFDNEEKRGADTQTDRQPREDGGLMTADQWMNTVDTRTGDFLAMRFQLEAARTSQ